MVNQSVLLSRRFDLYDVAMASSVAKQGWSDGLTTGPKCSVAVNVGGEKKQRRGRMLQPRSTSTPWPIPTTCSRRPRNRLKNAGSSMDNVLNVSVFLNDLKDHTAMTEAPS